MSYGQRLLCFFILAAATATAQPLDIQISINTQAERKFISPLIYGINAYVYDPEWTNGQWKTGLQNHAPLPNINITARRLGGNTMTSYNWENGMSNSGNDDGHSNNTYQSFITGTGGQAPYAPGAALETFHEHSRQAGTYSLLQLPAAGYVAADNNGPVMAQQKAPSSRWKQVVFDKPGSPASLSPNPDLNDDVIYVDEEIHFLMTRFGQASGGTGIQGYEIDNEPGLWHHYPEKNGNEGTHSLLHPELLRAGEVIEKNVALAKTIRRMDPTATIYGPAMWGYPEFYSLWSIYDDQTGTTYQPSDWGTYNREPYLTNNTGDAYRYNKMTWVNAYLAHMRAESDGAGGRLIDAFSVHYYPADAGTDAARLQAPRSLWDPTFVENSWITQQGNGFTDGRPLMLLPKLQQSINDFYPGTKLAITEYSFGGRHHVSGGIAQVDALGIFGRHGVYLATYFFTVDDYIAAAFKLYRNYDDNKGAFGDTSVSCTTSDLANSSAYASLDNQGRLHIIAVNKSLTREIQASVSIDSPEKWSSMRMYWFNGFSSNIGSSDVIPIGNGGAGDRSFTVSLPPLTAHHLVISPATSSGVELSPDGEKGSMTIEPNPFTGAAKINVLIPRAGETTVKLYDMLGRPVRTLLNGYYHAGTEVVSLDGTGLAAGLYVAVLTSGTERISVPVTLLQ